MFTLTTGAPPLDEHCMLFRVEAVIGDRPYMYVHRYPIVKRTARGFWVRDDHKQRFVLEGEGKRFAYTSVAKALHSFKRRKARQMLILTYQLEQTEKALQLADKTDPAQLQEKGWTWRS